MIVNKKYQNVFRDVPCSAIHFQDYNLPPYVDNVGYLEKIGFCLQNAPNANLPYYVNRGKHRPVILLEVDTSFFSYPSVNIGVNFYPIDPIGTTIKIRGYALSTKIPYVMFPIFTHFFTSAGLYRVDLIRTSDSMVIASTYVELVDLTTLESRGDLLYFNFMNFRADETEDTIDYPFGNVPTPHDTSFSLLIDGGLEIGSTSYSVEQETFRDLRYVPHGLHNMYKKNVELTIGTPKGVPEFIGASVNSVLCCSDIYVNGRKILSNGSAPEPTVVDKSYPFVTYKVQVEEVKTDLDDVYVR